MSNKTQAPLFISVGIMYRDGANYKDSNTYLYTNTTGISLEEVKLAFEDYIGQDEVLARQFGLENQAPIDHDSISVGPHDHCFNIITDIDAIFNEAEKKEALYYAIELSKDISEIIEAGKNGGTKDWFEYDRKCNEDKINSLKSTSLSYGYELVDKNELRDLKEAKERSMPFDVDPTLVQGLALMALSNPSMFEAALNGSKFTREQLHKMQAAMSSSLNL